MFSMGNNNASEAGMTIEAIADLMKAEREVELT
jgi:hypothetical protein